MTERDLEGLGPALTDFLADFSGCFGSARTFAHLGTYARGLLSDLPRKSVEPIALLAGTPVRTLQEFLRDHSWDDALARETLRARAASELAAPCGDGLGTVGLIDETSCVKKGDKTPGVQRQYLGCAGKVENGVVTVHLGACRGDFAALLDADLFLPESWAGDRARCRAAGIPDDLTHRPKWAIALEQHARARASGVVMDWLTFDEGYGNCPAFLSELDARGQRFCGEVPRSLRVLVARRDGLRPADATPSRAAEEVAHNAHAFRDRTWSVAFLARQTMADQVWRFKWARVWLRVGEGWSARPHLLIWASNDETGEEKFFLTNAPPEVDPLTALRAAFRRWLVEYLFRLCKTELGFAHFEGRNYGAMRRHLTVCLMGAYFVAGSTGRLRGEKPGADEGAGLLRPDGPGAGVGGVADPGRHRPLPAPEQGREAVKDEEAGRRPYSQKAQAAQAKTGEEIDCTIQVAL